MNPNSLGNKSLNLTFVALVPFPALETVIVQIAMPSTKYSFLSLVFLTDTSTIGSTWIVLFTVSWMFSPVTVNGLSGSPRASAFTSIVIVALVLASMFVTFQVKVCVSFLKSNTVKPVWLTTLMNSNPFGNTSINVRFLVQVSFARFSTMR